MAEQSKALVHSARAFNAQVWIPLRSVGDLVHQAGGLVAIQMWGPSCMHAQGCRWLRGEIREPRTLWVHGTVQQPVTNRYRGLFPLSVSPSISGRFHISSQGFVTGFVVGCFTYPKGEVLVKDANLSDKSRQSCYSDFVIEFEGTLPRYNILPEWYYLFILANTENVGRQLYVLKNVDKLMSVW